MSIENLLGNLPEHKSVDARNFYLCLAGLFDEIFKKPDMLSEGPFNSSQFPVALKSLYEQIADPDVREAVTPDYKLGLSLHRDYVAGLSVQKHAEDIERIGKLASMLLRGQKI